ncbi:hint module-domain-containing protein [Obelidium mucronatum]|nr:hint module-domain-containing protein [Obelidium mucronatum]
MGGDHSRRILVLGNARAGKSSFLNALLVQNGFEEAPPFKAGISIGQGLTDKLQVQKFRAESEMGVTAYCDVPGLADSALQNEAIDAVTQALQMPFGPFKLIFMVTQMNGMIVKQDLETVKCILRAIKSRVEFGVVVNQIPRDVMKALKVKSNEEKMRNQVYEALEPLEGRHEIPRIYFEGIQNKAGSWTPSKGLFEFANQLPFNDVDAKNIGTISVLSDELYNRMEKVKEDQAKALEKEKAESERIRKLAQAESERQRREMEHLQNQYNSRQASYESRGCFPGDAMVQTPSGNIKLCTVELGDYIRVSAKDAKFERVVGWYDHFPDASRSFTVLTFADGSNASLTPNHMLFASPTKDVDSLVAHQAGNVKPGMFVASVNSAIPLQVIAVSEETRLGIFSPVVFGDKVVVDGILMSAYAKPSAFVDVEISDVWVHTLCHAGSFPIRMSLSVSSSTAKESSSLVSWMLPAIKSIIGGSVKSATSFGGLTV